MVLLKGFSKKTALVSFAAFLLCVGGAVTFFLQKNSNDDNDTNQNQAEQETIESNVLVDDFRSDKLGTIEDQYRSGDLQVSKENFLFVDSLMYDLSNKAQCDEVTKIRVLVEKAADELGFDQIVQAYNTSLFCFVSKGDKQAYAGEKANLRSYLATHKGEKQADDLLGNLDTRYNFDKTEVTNQDDRI
ncbi:hypothetical protein KC992_00255 [Candidatus Saccharibacteria bacterium]|nr:hypothetical protein [Candidatus Saccharibacteria bacterium]MCB0214525.1 hypothetical protein [Anaerolineae bacterium]